MNVTEVAELSDGKIYTHKSSVRKELIGILTSVDTVSRSFPDGSWQIQVVVDRGPGAREAFLHLKPLITKADYEESKLNPIFLSGTDMRFVFFQR